MTHMLNLKKWLYLIGFILLFALCLLSFSGCNSNPASGESIKNGVVTVDNPLCSYTFDLPDNYKLRYTTADYDYEDWFRYVLLEFTLPRIESS